MRATSIAALETVPIGPRQAQVIDALRKLGAATDKEISEATGLPINCVTGRRGELVAMGKVIERGTVEYKVNGRTIKATTWSLAVAVPNRTTNPAFQGQGVLL